MKKLVLSLAFAACAATVLPSWASPDRLDIRKLAERSVDTLPEGPLVWRIERFGSLAEAQAAAGPYGIAAQSKDGAAWLFTLGASGGKPSGTPVAEVGPIKPLAASRYLLRINEATGAPHATTPVHSHPGSEAFYVISGEQTIRGPHGELKVQPGQPSAGSGAHVPMQVTSTGSTDLHALVMFVVDADKPFSSPAKMP